MSVGASGPAAVQGALPPPYGTGAGERTGMDERIGAGDGGSTPTSCPTGWSSPTRPAG